jgi:hypothetical protein
MATVNTDTSILVSAAWKRVKKAHPLAAGIKHDFELLMWQLEMAGDLLRESDLSEHAETLCFTLPDVRKAVQVLVKEGFWQIEQGCIRSLNVLEQLSGYTKRTKNLRRGNKIPRLGTESGTESAPRQEQNSIEQYKNCTEQNRTEDPALPPTAPTEALLDDADEFEKLAWEQLEHPDGTKDFEQRGEFLSDGRRPMKKYPMLWFKPGDLAELLRDFDGTIGRENIRVLFQHLKSRAESNQQHKGEPWKMSPFAWATGYARTEVLRSVQAQISLESTRRRAAK